MNKLLDEVIKIAKDAGDAIVRIYEKGFDVEYKSDKSPLTNADKTAHNIIKNGLNNLEKKYPILSEEGKNISYSERKKWQKFWLVDPLDGTKEFVKKNGEFTVNIALIENNTPVLGVIYAPVLNDVYYAKNGIGSFKNKQKLPLIKNNNTKEKLVVVASKSHLSEDTKKYINGLRQKTNDVKMLSIGSSLKFCIVAEGKADVYPRLSPTMEWDTVAAQIIITEAGKKITQYKDNKELEYNKENLLNSWFVVK